MSVFGFVIILTGKLSSSIKLKKLIWFLKSIEQFKFGFRAEVSTIYRKSPIVCSTNSFNQFQSNFLVS